MEQVVSENAVSEILSRAIRTLSVMHEWGYAPSIETLASDLLGGRTDAESLLAALVTSEEVRVDHGFACLRGYENLLEKSRRRTAANRLRNGHAMAIAVEYARDLAAACPLVECVGLSGSVASGGYELGDDIDFDLIVRPGTKYTCYLLATFVGLRYAWRHRAVRMDSLQWTPFVPKIICINVVWTTDQTRPFIRQDSGLAFELLRYRPLLGSTRYREILVENPWILRWFPQVYERIWIDRFAVEHNAVGRLVFAIARRPRLLRLVEGASRALAWVLYTSVQALRNKDPAARARMAFLRRVKYPYEVFQD